MRLLLLSNSTNPEGTFLGHVGDVLRDFLPSAVQRVLFVPYAGVRLSWDDYAARVAERLGTLGLAVDALHEADDPVAAVQRAEAIVVGGGNTFHLVKHLYESHLVRAIRARVREGVPYVGWSAGANVACPTLRTTNDMPIVAPPSFRTLDLVPFQINPHYTDQHPPGHRGETRDERLEEFVTANPEVLVVGLREGSWLRVAGGTARLEGPHPARLFRHACPPEDVDPGWAMAV